MLELRSAILFTLPWVLAGAMLAGSPEGTHMSRIGALEVTTLLDTEMQLPTSLLQGIDPKVVAEIYQGKPTVTTPANAFLVHMGRHLVLVDTGGSKAMNPDMGHIVERLRALGVKPEQIEAVLITHFHGDHMGGLLTADGHRAFPNAVLCAAAAEGAYWLDPKTESKLPEARRPMIGQIKAALAPYIAAGKYKPFALGREPFPGVKAFPAQGHTPGSTVYMFTSGHLSFWAVGDIVHYGAVQFQHPEATVLFDSNADQAALTRLTIWQRAAQAHAVVGAAHLAFPGVGHVEALTAKSFKWVPLP